MNQETNIDEYKLQISYNKWINNQNKHQRGCIHITKKIFSENLNHIYIILTGGLKIQEKLDLI